jgi:hypothetical protein
VVIADVVDLERYPIDRIDSPLVEHCRETLRSQSALKLDGFIRADAVERMVADARQLAAKGYRNDETHNAYFDDGIDESLPPDHPRRVVVRSAQRAVAMDLLPADFVPRVVYDSDEMLRFVAAVLEQDVLYRSDDPFDGCNLTVYEAGDELGWHFDQSEFSVTLMIQRAERGGDFEYAPMIRRPDDERYLDVLGVLTGESLRVVRLAGEPGTLAFFRGRYSLHRVTPVEGSTPRMNSVLTYSVEPGHELSATAQQMYYGRTA